MQDAQGGGNIDFADAFVLREGLTQDQLDHFLTNSQIQHFNDLEDSGIPSDDVCAICMEAMNKYSSMKLPPPCSHHFHSDCIKNWLLTKATCPFCNIDVRRRLL
jgi:hypothetical protein